MRIQLISLMLLLITSLHAERIQNSSSSTIAWSKDFVSALEEAKRTVKPVILVISNHDCRHCKKLEGTTFKDPKIIELMNRSFVPVIVYTDERDYYPRSLAVRGTPAMWFLYGDGYPMDEPLYGAVPADLMEKVLKAYSEIFKKTYLKRRSH